MTCRCPKECAFRWREWTTPSSALSYQLSHLNSVKQTAYVEGQRAAGIDVAFQVGIGSSQPSPDVRRFVAKKGA